MPNQHFLHKGASIERPAPFFFSLLFEPVPSCWHCPTLLSQLPRLLPQARILDVQRIFVGTLLPETAHKFLSLQRLLLTLLTIVHSTLHRPNTGQKYLLSFDPGLRTIAAIPHLEEFS